MALLSSFSRHHAGGARQVGAVWYTEGLAEPGPAAVPPRDRGLPPRRTASRGRPGGAPGSVGRRPRADLGRVQACLATPRRSPPMKTAFSSAVLAVLLVAPGPCFALWEIAPVSQELAKKMGMEVRSERAGPNHVRVELAFKTEGELKVFTEGELKD